MEKIVAKYISAEEWNAYRAEGYRYRVEGHYTLNGMRDFHTDWPAFDTDYTLFSDHKKALAYANTQVYPYNNNIVSKVEEIPEHTETPDEYHVRLDRERAERKTKAKSRGTKKQR